MDEPQRPAELSEEAWQQIPLEGRHFIALLVARVAALEARLNQNSNNSSKPPSSDPPSAPPRPTKTPRGKPKTKGAQPGHPDQQRELLPEAAVDKVVPLRPSCCSSCHADLPDTLPSLGLPRRQQVFELPEFKPLVTEYQYHSVCCPQCRAFVTAPRPAEVPPGSFGPRAVALIALLHGRYRISNREVVALLRMVWLLPVSLGSVANLQQVASSALAPAYAEVQAAIEAEDHVNADETRWREGQRKPWLWVAVGSVATLFLLAYGRGKKQLGLLLGETFAGLVSSDRFTAYNSLPTERRQLCWAHIVRNLRGRAEAKGPWQEEAAALLGLAEEVLVVWAKYREGELSKAAMKEQLQVLQAAIRKRLEDNQQQSNYLGSLCSELVKHFCALWTFVEHEGVEPTNNAAERALRPAVLWRKGCYGTQSESGSRFVERMLTVSATCQQHERPLLPYLVDAIAAYWAGQPAPRVLPSTVTP
ncbi:IS66 family transposase [Scytonema tolypothrichoides VB-61278]|nr:IS66 family transposase [Scytonema tolypothrichoides VB-61278]